ncbi:hypothetical protein IMG5_118000 [Ichthyophthirius multifiliis]|uniref:Uncharacterized protein n=1 Tax=Ichthyophthirius multifiliis TaxID=5932 RepID=G0QUM9_ICHMU|nr:hypothetical protein IMG5_118000 [Ichthyophthirius multifiliis]EGR31075.1 hypothetical protein IMG5_118000 [Ichthyophthirius multifiliis]|eukprot:XP_004034561.1 hypothetical protein IMG5_118000 [Ichthyophthirius multifiliis]
MHYEIYQLSPYVNFCPLENNKEIRNGAEQEYNIRGKMGFDKDTDLVQIQDSFFKCLETPLNSFISPHHSIRSYFQYRNYVEGDYEFYLQHEKLNLIDNLDPSLILEYNLLKNDFIDKTPGYYSRIPLNDYQTEMQYYLNNNINLPNDCGFIQNIDQYCPQKIIEIEIDDQITDDDSDGEESPIIEVIFFQEIQIYLNKKRFKKQIFFYKKLNKAIKIQKQ